MKVLWDRVGKYVAWWIAGALFFVFLPWSVVVLTGGIVGWALLAEFGSDTWQAAVKIGRDAFTEIKGYRIWASMPRRKTNGNSDQE